MKQEINEKLSQYLYFLATFKKVGTHRRIALKHLIEYEKKLKQTRKQNLDFLAEQAQELNLGY